MCVWLLSQEQPGTPRMAPWDPGLRVGREKRICGAFSQFKESLGPGAFSHSFQLYPSSQENTSSRIYVNTLGYWVWEISSHDYKKPCSSPFVCTRRLRFRGTVNILVQVQRWSTGRVSSWSGHQSLGLQLIDVTHCNMGIVFFKKYI